MDMDKLQWISAQHFVTEWRTQTGHSALLRTFKEEVEKCYGARSDTLACRGMHVACTVVWVRVRVNCWPAPLSRVGADAAVDLFSWNYVERVAGLMLEVSRPTCGR